MSDSPFRWGIIGPGNIAHKFADGLKHTTKEAVVAAVASRSKERATQFAHEYGADKVYGSYEELAADSSLDAVYVATPHSEHRSGAKLCIKHGRPVLVEKPFTINAAETKEVVALARSKNVFCMEGMWSRFFPAMVKLRELVKNGDIGEVKLIHADFGFRTDVNPEGRLFDPRLGGGALLDVGIYPVSFSCMLLGMPVKSAALADLGTTKVDEVTGILLQFQTGAVAVLSTAVRVSSPWAIQVCGENGSVQIPGTWWKPDKLIIKRNGKDDEVFDSPYPGSGFQFEADEVQRCVRAGLKESPVVPLDETVKIMELLDSIRSQIGLVYPADSSH